MLKRDNVGLEFEITATQMVDYHTGYRDVYPDANRAEKNRIHMLHFFRARHWEVRLL